MNKIIITGGCGFIGSHVVEHFLKNTNWEICILDKLTYASRGFERIRDINAYHEDRVLLLTTDITREIPEGILHEVRGANWLFHLAAETHVDNSILDPKPFVMSNLLGTFNILEFVKKLPNLKGMLYMSTDEVFGPASAYDAFNEWDRYNCTNPYSATKAGAEELCLAYANTYSLPIFIVHTMNVFGERQHPEKFIPMCIRKILRDETVTIHSDITETISGSRFYIHARNFANAAHFLLGKFERRQKYNIVGECEIKNYVLAQTIAEIMGKKLHFEMVNFHESRPGHDLRYALDGSKMAAMGWRVPMTFRESFERTIKWTLDNPRWLDWSI